MVQQKNAHKRPQIYGILGERGVGKDTFSNLIVDLNPSFKVMHFADPLKRMASKIFNLSEEDMHDPLKKDLPLPNGPIELDYYLGKMKFETGLDVQKKNQTAISLREVLQKFGTDYIRNTEPSYWVEKLKGEIGDRRKIIVPDIRFQNEAEALKSKEGKLIRILRIDKPSVNDLHSSEREGRCIKADLTLGLRTGDLLWGKRVATLIEKNKFNACIKYDYENVKRIIELYTQNPRGYDLARSLKMDYSFLTNLLDYYEIPRTRVSKRFGHKTVDGTLFKKCHCGWQPITLFASNSRTWDGLNGQCKVCASEWHKNKYKKYGHTLKDFYMTAKKGAGYRGLEFAIDFPYVAKMWNDQKGKCFYTKSPLTLTKGEENKVTLDRKNSSKGYVAGNVVLCTYKVNIMKGTSSIEEFKNLVKLLHQHIKTWE